MEQKPRDIDCRRFVITDKFVADKDAVRAKARAKVVSLGDGDRIVSLEIAAKVPNKENRGFSDYWFLVRLEPQDG